MLFDQIKQIQKQVSETGLLPENARIEFTLPKAEYEALQHEVFNAIQFPLSFIYSPPDLVPVHIVLEKQYWGEFLNKIKQ